MDLAVTLASGASTAPWSNGAATTPGRRTG